MPKSSTPQTDSQPALHALQLTVSGRVQGVGFRPFVYRLAHQFGLRGWVRNEAGTVEIRDGLPACSGSPRKS